MQLVPSSPSIGCMSWDFTYNNSGPYVHRRGNSQQVFHFISHVTAAHIVNATHPHPNNKEKYPKRDKNEFKSLLEFLTFTTPGFISLLLLHV